MPNGSHSSGPGWADVLSEDKIRKMIQEIIRPLVKRIKEIEQLLVEQKAREK